MLSKFAIATGVVIAFVFIAAVAFVDASAMEKLNTVIAIWGMMLSAFALYYLHQNFQQINKSNSEIIRANNAQLSPYPQLSNPQLDYSAAVNQFRITFKVHNVGSVPIYDLYYQSEFFNYGKVGGLCFDGSISYIGPGSSDEIILLIDGCHHKEHGGPFPMSERLNLKIFWDDYLGKEKWLKQFFLMAYDADQKLIIGRYE